jgi:hypothetical protein
MIKETYTAMLEGWIKAYRRYADGRMQLVADKHNVITYRAADIMAKVLGGDATYMPSRMGFIYADDNKSFQNPGSKDDPRLEEWTSSASEIQGNGGNMIICSLATPAFSVLGDPGLYSNNLVTVSSMSDKNAPLAFFGAGYDTGGPVAGDKYFQVMLLARTFTAGNTSPVYTPYAMAQLTDTDDGIAVENNTELVVYWGLGFK